MHMRKIYAIMDSIMKKRILSVILAIAMLLTATPLMSVASESEYVYMSVSYDDKYINIVKALNIKSKKERLEYVYDEAIKYLDAFLNGDLDDLIANLSIVEQKEKLERIKGNNRISIEKTEYSISLRLRKAIQ